MGLFNRKSAQTAIATGAEIDAAAKALATGEDTLANQLCDRAGADSRAVAMAILARSVDYAPQG
ncbi:hypothetical protein AB0F36_14275 [Streptomyces sp. NPDC029080]|uniref:hypothetical protein n=1 Tax=Streptomyces sp. NPDC029080 TaxID=3155017 RepID=UPI0033EE26AD